MPEPDPSEADRAESSDRISSHPDPYFELFERSADAILIIEGDRFVDCNRATVEMLRCQDKAEVLRTHPSELSPPIQPDGRSSFEKANAMIAIAFEQGSHRFEWHHRRMDGEDFPVEVLLTAVQDKGRRTLHVVWRDITERKQLERNLRHAQKMEAIGKLAGGIAHDFNNLLVGILGHADLLQRRLGDRPELAASAQQIRIASRRAAELVRQLLAFGRKQDRRPRLFDLRQLVEHLEQLLVRLIGAHVRLETTLADEPVLVRADPGQVEQVVLNLVTNARDAMPDGGRLVLDVRTVQVDPDSATATSGRLEPGAWARLSVVDEGIGMDRETASRAFDPFFTTKRRGQGTGLGLATVDGIVEQSRGVVDLDSAPGRGTTVRVHFPLVEGDFSPEDLPGDEETLIDSGGTETILLAEDEAVVARLVRKILANSGYEVLVARNGLEAFEIWDRQRHDIDLVLTDVVMPEMGGIDLVRRLREAGYPGPVLFASGYTDESLPRLREMGEVVDLLEKPFGRDQLVGRVRRALDRSRGETPPPRA